VFVKVAGAQLYRNGSEQRVGEPAFNKSEQQASGYTKAGTLTQVLGRRQSTVDKRMGGNL
jgi:hypothetical protein